MKIWIPWFRRRTEPIPEYVAFRKACSDLFVAVTDALRIPALLDWLQKEIGGGIMREPPPAWVFDLAKTSPYSIHQLDSYEHWVRDALKSRGETDPAVIEEFVRVGVDIALAENRELGVDHIRRLPPEDEQ